MLRLSHQELAELRRKAYSNSPAQLAAAIDAAGIPADLVSIGQAANYAQVSLSFIRRRIRAGGLNSWRNGWRHLVSLSQVLQQRDTVLIRFQPKPPATSPTSETRART